MLLRVAILLVLVFLVLCLLRGLRLLVASRFSSRGRGAGRQAVNGEMVRDPVCGTWIDRTMAVAGRSGDQWVPLCSERCRARLEAR